MVSMLLFFLYRLYKVPKIKSLIESAVSVKQMGDKCFLLLGIMDFTLVPYLYSPISSTCRLQHYFPLLSAAAFPPEGMH